MEARLKTGIWVSMALRMGNLSGRFGVVLRKGDDDAGGVLVVLRGRDGLSVLGQVRTPQGELVWMRGTGADVVTQEVADAYVARRVRMDTDLWVLEFDAPDLLPPFEGRVL